MTENPNAIPEHLRDLSQETREEVATALATIQDYLRDATSQRLYELLQDEGWYGACEDCRCYLGIDQLGNPCHECGHVNGDPFTGSTPDDIPMRVCNSCKQDAHWLCDGVGDPEDDESPPFCNCARIDHPPVTTPRLKN